MTLGHSLEEGWARVLYFKESKSFGCLEAEKMPSTFSCTRSEVSPPLTLGTPDLIKRIIINNKRVIQVITTRSSKGQVNGLGANMPHKGNWPYCHNSNYNVNSTQSDLN